MGLCLSIVHGLPIACVIAAMYVEIPYTPGVDIATGLGASLGICIVYIHYGGAPFIHTYTCETDAKELVQDRYLRVATQRSRDYRGDYNKLHKDADGKRDNSAEAKREAARVSAFA